MVKVLVSDDSILTRTMLKNILSEKGHQITEAVDGNDAIAKYFEIKPDIVFMDLVMPGKDGLSAIKDIVSKDSAAKIIVCSADVQDFRVSEAIEAGAVDYVTKPFDGPKILDVLDKCLKSAALEEVRRDITTERAILKDFVKNGIIRGTQALSKMIDKPVKVSISDFRSIPPAEITGYMGMECIGVEYELSGSITGSTSLLVQKQAGFEIIGVLTGSDVTGQDEVVHSVFNEMGNVFINSFLSTFSDLMDIQITFEAPKDVDEQILPSILESVQFQGEVPEAYMVKGKFIIDGIELIMFLVLHTDIKSVAYKYDLKPGTNYMVIETGVGKSFDMFKYMVKRGFKGLYVTRKNPEDVRNEMGNENLPMVWLTTEEVKVPNCICTTNLPKIGKVIESFYSKVNNAILFIDNIKYLVDTNSAGMVNGFIEEMKTRTIHKKNIMIISYDPSVYEKEFLSRMDFEIIE